MEANKMFEVAVRNKFRYPYKGVIATEDLWDLPVQQLDGIFKTLKSQEKKAQEESLLDTRTPEDEILTAKIEIIKYIVNTKLEEAKQAERAKERIDERLLAAYDRIRRNVRNGLAVVTVKRDACGGCFNRIPPQRQADIRQGKKIIICEYCGRILVADPEVAEE